ncbi:MAG: formate dehydrogenase accessory sulfurtransferase FdhD [Thermoplasmatales archaeon]|nr:formate dehydrogenase accessory sulfurtransferase FdhD [Thermoplasmatales archaeon]MCW6170905.1 formate dehydrogenase accessory sulfurtransferase FdhD [Thermoplasmatales archaeon]
MNSGYVHRYPGESGTMNVPVAMVRNQKLLKRRTDKVAVEEPLQITVSYNGSKTRNYAIIMRTPTMDKFLGTGFLFSEGAMRSPEDIISVRNVKADGIAIDNTIEFDLKHEFKSVHGRNFVVNSSCGVCGKNSVDDIFLRIGRINRSSLRVTSDFITELPKRLIEYQAVFEETGGVHAAAIFDEDGKMLISAEDVGRHNAVDKVIGYMLWNHLLPAWNFIMQVSGRAGFEIVQKAAIAGIPIVSSVSAPSSLSIEAADVLGITLICFVRENGFNVYTHQERIIFE